MVVASRPASTFREPSAAPIITPTWGLFVRRRSMLYQRFFASLRDALADETFAVPAPLAAVVADVPSELDGADTDTSRLAVGERLMISLPTNPEQEQVATRLAHHRGVTVQGAPGTGKTHTIANLFSHPVAHGKRVLVTSQKEQTLTVLRDKMPEDLRPLCDSVLGGSTSLAELDQSVQAIYERAVGLDRMAARRGAVAYSAELDHVKREVQRLRDRIRTAAERERAVYDLDGAELSVLLRVQPSKTELGASFPLPDGETASRWRGLLQSPTTCWARTKLETATSKTRNC
jgi:hypothetical protein